MAPILALILSILSLSNIETRYKGNSCQEQYFRRMLDINNPNSLKEKVDVEIAETLSEYFIAYSNQINHIDSIKHMQDSQVIAMHIYGYEGKSISKNTSTYFQSDDLKKCISLIKKKEIETECFNKNGQLISKEYFNKESKYYSFENYDSTGTRVYHEWGKF